MYLFDLHARGTILCCWADHVFLFQFLQLLPAKLSTLPKFPDLIQESLSRGNSVCSIIQICQHLFRIYVESYLHTQEQLAIFLVSFPFDLVPTKIHIIHFGWV